MGGHSTRQSDRAKTEKPSSVPIHARVPIRSSERASERVSEQRAESEQRAASDAQRATRSERRAASDAQRAKRAKRLPPKRERANAQRAKRQFRQPPASTSRSGGTRDSTSPKSRPTPPAAPTHPPRPSVGALSCWVRRGCCILSAPNTLRHFRYKKNKGCRRTTKRGGGGVRAKNGCGCWRMILAATQAHRAPDSEASALPRQTGLVINGKLDPPLR